MSYAFLASILCSSLIDYLALFFTQEPWLIFFFVVLIAGSFFWCYWQARIASQGIVASTIFNGTCCEPQCIDPLSFNPHSSPEFKSLVTSTTLTPIASYVVLGVYWAVTQKLSPNSSRRLSVIILIIYGLLWILWVCITGDIFFWFLIFFLNILPFTCLLDFILVCIHERAGAVVDPLSSASSSSLADASVSSCASSASVSHLSS